MLVNTMLSSVCLDSRRSEGGNPYQEVIMGNHLGETENSAYGRISQDITTSSALDGIILTHLHRYKKQIWPEGSRHPQI